MLMENDWVFCFISTAKDRSRGTEGGICLWSHSIVFIFTVPGSTIRVMLFTLPVQFTIEKQVRKTTLLADHAELYAEGLRPGFVRAVADRQDPEDRKGESPRENASWSKGFLLVSLEYRREEKRR